MAKQKKTQLNTDSFASDDPAERRKQITHATDDPAAIEAERHRFRPRNDPQREASIDTFMPDSPDVVLNQDRTA